MSWGVVVTEAQADELLAGLQDRLVAKAAPEDREPTKAEEWRGAVLGLLVRHILAGTRDSFVQRVVAVRRN